MGQSLNVGLVGAGNISRAYLATVEALPSLNLVAVADLDESRAQEAANRSQGARVMTLDDLIASDDVDVILNLTVPEAHAAVALAAIAAGKHVYGEKPLASTTKDALTVINAAAKAGVKVGCAPDTVLGIGIQTARRAVEDGLIGQPLAATAVMVTPGHERWHPNPEFYYLPGGGPLLDMGPYYLSALVHLLGPVHTVTGVTSRPRPVRTIATGPRTDSTFETSIDTHVTGLLEHASGAVTTLLMSFDVTGTVSAPLEIHGTHGSLVVPDPNLFDGVTKLQLTGETTWQPLPVSAGFRDGSRGFGLADMAHAIAEHRPHRASADLAYHVLDVSLTLLRAADERRALPVASTCDVPSLVPLS